MLDPIADMLTRIRNAQKAGKEDVQISASKLKLAIARILEKEGFVEEVSQEKGEKFNFINVKLKYYPVSATKKLPAIKDIKRVSKEGQRVYVRSKEISKVRNNFGIAIVSTSKGVMTGDESRKLGLGGEYVCQVW